MHIHKIAFGCRTIMNSVFFLLILIISLPACSYSITVTNINGSAQPDPTNSQEGFYHLKKVTIIDTVVNLSLLQDGVMLLPSCPANGIHSLQYKISFGDMLRNTFTFGKRKKINVKYVCIKNTN